MTNPQFRDQVEWENSRLAMSDFVAVNFEKDTLSPITLLELGSFGKTKPMAVCCPKEFWRKGNVDIFCSLHNIPVVEGLEDLCLEIEMYFKYRR